MCISFEIEVSLHNQYREQNQLRNLEAHVDLVNAAKIHAEWMFRKKRLSHYGPWFSTVYNRVRSISKLNILEVGENVALNYGSFAKVFDSWLKSERHRNNILNPAFTHMGYYSVVPYHCVVYAQIKSVKLFDS